MDCDNHGNEQLIFSRNLIFLTLIASVLTMQQAAGEEVLAPRGTAASLPIQERQLYEKEPRPGALQSVFHSTTAIVTDAAHLGITEFDFSATVGLPFPTRASPLLITPAFGLDVLNADGFDLPGELYDGTLEVRHLRPIRERLMLDLAVQPGVFGNLESGNPKFRFQGRAVGVFEWSYTTKSLLGAAFLDRDDVSLLPIAGLIWTPTDFLQLDLLFPRPRVALRGRCDHLSAWWLYTGGEFGGGSWAVERLSGSGDVVTLSDVRVLIGMERQSAFLSGRIEVGYAFDRRVEYASGLGDTTLDSAAFARAVVNY